MTVKLPGRSAIEYCSFKSWEQANAPERTILKIREKKREQTFCKLILLRKRKNKANFGINVTDEVNVGVADAHVESGGLRSGIFQVVARFLALRH